MWFKTTFDGKSVNADDLRDVAVFANKRDDKPNVTMVVVSGHDKQGQFVMLASIDVPHQDASGLASRLQLLVDRGVSNGTGIIDLNIR